MKHRILVNGRNQNIMPDFFQHTESFFDTLSTSEQQNDVIGHFQIFKPEVYVIFADMGADQVIKHVAELKSNHYYNGASIVVIGDAEACSQIERKGREAADLVIRRPVTADNLALRINRFLEDPGSMRSRGATFSEKTSQADALIKAAEAALSDVNIIESNVSSGKRHILVVYDDRTVLKMIKSALDEKYDITTMANGAMVDKVLAAKKVDLIILDYEMPIETGADIFRRIRKNPKWADIPVCFLTGVSDREKIMEVMSLKPHGYILKPIDMEALSSTIKNIIG